MANIKSAKKRISVTEKKTLQNKMIKSEIKTAIKTLKNLASEGKIEEASKFLSEVFALIDSAASKNVLHKNNAAHKKAACAKLVDKAKQAK